MNDYFDEYDLEDGLTPSEQYWLELENAYNEVNDYE